MPAVSPLIIDVREPDEFVAGHVTGALNIPLNTLTHSQKIAQVSKDTPLVLYCRSGARAEVGASILQRRGFTDVTNGINAEQVSKLDVDHM